MENEEKKVDQENQEVKMENEEKKVKAEKKHCCEGLCPCKAFAISLLTSIIVVAIYHCARILCAPRCPKEPAAMVFKCPCMEMRGGHDRKMMRNLRRNFREQHGGKFHQQAPRMDKGMAPQAPQMDKAMPPQPAPQK